MLQVRLQCQSDLSRKYKGTFHCFMTILRVEKTQGLFKGMASPMAGVAAINSLLFGVYGTTLRYLSPDQTLPTISNIAIAGGVSGTVNSILSCPIELMKTRLQVQGSSSANPTLYKGPLDCLVKTWKAGGLRGCYHGMTATLIREAPSYAAYFASYEYILRLMTPPGKNTRDLSPMAIMFAGGLGGIIAWLSSYPADVIKTRLQAQSEGSKIYTSTWDCVMKSYRSQGWKIFFVGLNSAIIRAFPVNAVIFLVYEVSLRLLGGV
eukprot:Sdes_comp19362_c0_seq1m10605